MKRNDQNDTLAIFEVGTRDGLTVAAGRFRCGLCNTMGVDEAGELCAACAATVLTSKRRPRYTRPPIETKTATRKPRKTTERKPPTSRKSRTASRDAG